MIYDHYENTDVAELQEHHKEHDSIAICDGDKGIVVYRTEGEE